MVFDISVAMTWVLFMALFPITFYWARNAWRILFKRDYSYVALKRGEPPANPEKFAPYAAAINLIAQANHDFNAVSHVMHQRRLLGQRGVEWSSPRGRAIFVFEPFSYLVPKGMTLGDVTSGKRIALPGDRNAKLARYHTYVLAPK